MPDELESRYRVSWTDRDGRIGSVELWYRTAVLNLVDALLEVGCTHVYTIDLKTGEVL